MPYQYSWKDDEPCLKCGKIRPDHCILIDDPFHISCFKCLKYSSNLHILFDNRYNFCFGHHKHVNAPSCKIEMNNLIYSFLWSKCDLCELIVTERIGQRDVYEYKWKDDKKKITPREVVVIANDIYYGWIKEKPKLPEAKYDIEFSFGD